MQCPHCQHEIKLSKYQKTLYLYAGSKYPNVYKTLSTMAKGYGLTTETTYSGITGLWDFTCHYVVVVTGECESQEKFLDLVDAFRENLPNVMIYDKKAR